MSEPHELQQGDAVVVHVQMEILCELGNGLCVACGFDSLRCAIAVMTAGESIIGGPALYTRCERGCDDGETIAIGRAGP